MPRLLIAASAVALSLTCAVAAETPTPIDIWSSDVGKHITESCTREWPNDFAMRVFCENKQVKALNELRSRHPKIDETAK